MQICSKCKVEKELSEFPTRRKGKLRGQCRICYLEVVSIRKAKPKLKVSSKCCFSCKKDLPSGCFTTERKNKDGLSGKCNECRKPDSKLYYETHKDTILSKSKNYYNINKETIQKTSAEYRHNNSDKINAQRKERRKTPEAKQKRKEWEAKNPHIKLMKILRSRHNDFFRYNIQQGLKYSTTKALGCTPQEFHEYLVSNFGPGMTMDNHGKVWEIDHTFPLSKIDLNNEEEMMLATHFLNLKPMLKVDNMKKSDSIVVDKELHFKWIREYISEKKLHSKKN